MVISDQCVRLGLDFTVEGRGKVIRKELMYRSTLLHPKDRPWSSLTQRWWRFLVLAAVVSQLAVAPGFAQGHGEKCIGHPQCGNGHNAGEFDPGEGRAFNKHERVGPWFPPQYQTGAGDPIVVASGEFVETAADFKIPSLSFDFMFERSWASMADYDGPMGRRWDNTHFQRLVAHSDDKGDILSVDFIDGRGGSMHFARVDQQDDMPMAQRVIPIGALLSASWFGGTAQWAAPTSEQLQDPPDVFFPPRSSGSTEVIDYSTGQFVRVVPGKGRAFYQLALTLEQLDGMNNAAALNVTIVSLYGASHYRVPMPPPHYDLGSPNPNDGHYRIVRFENNFGSTITYQYESNHPDGIPLVTDRLTSIVDTQNRAYALEYYETESDPQRFGRVRRIVDFVGRAIEYLYDDNGNLTAVVELPGEPLERKTLYTYAAGEFHALLTREAPNEAADPNVRKPSLRNRYTGRKVLQQEYGEAAFTETMAGDSGNPGEPCYRLEYVAYWPTASGSPVAKEVLFTDRTGTRQRCFFNDDGQMERLVEYDDHRTYTTWYGWHDGRLVGQTAPKSDPSDPTHVGRTTLWIYDHENDDPRMRGNLLRKEVHPEVGSAPDRNETVHVHTYADYDPTWLVPRHEVNPRGKVITRTLTAEGSVENPTGYLVTETTTGADGLHSITTTMHRDSLGRRDWIVDSEGVKHLNIYEPGTDNVVETRVNPETDDIFLSASVYDARGNVVAKTNARGKVTTYVYDRLDRRKHEYPPGSSDYSVTYLYDANGMLAKKIYPDRPGVMTWIKYERDVLGAVVETRTPRGDGVEIVAISEYDASGRIVKSTDPEGVSTVYDWDERSLLKFVRVADGTDASGTKSFEYDHNGSTILTTEFTGEVHVREYDRHGRLIRRIKPDGRSNDTVYVGMEAAEGVEVGSDGKIYRRTKHHYDSLGREYRIEYMAKDAPGGEDIGDGWATVTKEHDGLGRLTRRTDESGSFSETHHDVLGRVEFQLDPIGNRIDFTYDQASSLVVEKKITEVSDSNFGGTGPVVRTWAYAYDDMGRQISATDPASATTTIEFDYSGQALRTKDHSGDVVEREFDLLGNLKAERRLEWNGSGLALLSEETATHDLASRVLTRTNATGLVTTYDHDALGRVVKVTHPDATEETWEWNALGLATRYVDQVGSVFVHGYDENARLTSTTTHAGIGVVGGSQTTTYVYDSGGRQVGVYANDSTIERTFNTLGNQTSETQTIGDAPPRTFESTYDVRGKRTGVDFPTIGGCDISLSFVRDASDRVLDLTETIDGVATPLASYGYEGIVGVLGANYGNGTTLRIVYDLRGTPTSVRHSSGGAVDLLSAERVLDAEGRIAWRRIRHGDGAAHYHEAVHHYRYDGADRVGQIFRDVTAPAFSSVGPNTIPTAFGDHEDYSWTSTDQRDEIVRTNGPLEEFYYDGMLDLERWRRGALDLTFGIDDVGNRTSEEVLQQEDAAYSYNVHNRLVSIIFVNGKALGFDYDGMGRRVKTTIVDVNGVDEIWHYYDGNSRVLDVEEGNQPTIKSAAYFGVEGSAPTASRWFGGSSVGELRFLHADDEASIGVVTDGNGDVVQHYRYSNDYGRVEAYVGMTSVPVALRDAPFPQPYAWHSRRVEIGAAPEKILYDAEPRFYDAETQSYLQRMGETPSAGGGSQPSASNDDPSGSFTGSPGSSGPSPIFPLDGPEGGGGPGGETTTFDTPKWNGGGGPPDPPKSARGIGRGGHGYAPPGGGHGGYGLPGPGGGGVPDDGRRRRRPTPYDSGSPVDGGTADIARRLGLGEVDLQVLIDESRQDLLDWFDDQGHLNDREFILHTFVWTEDGETNVESVIIWDSSFLAALKASQEQPAQETGGFGWLENVLDTVETVAGFASLAFGPTPLGVVARGVVAASAAINIGISLVQGDVDGALAKAGSALGILALGKLGALGGGGAASATVSNAAKKGGENARKATASLSRQKQAGHTPGTPQHDNRVRQGKPTSTFFGKESGERATQIANRRGTPVPNRPSVKEYDFGLSVGTGPNGGMQTRVRVHTDSKGRIHGHPSGPEKR